MTVCNLVVIVHFRWWIIVYFIQNKIDIITKKMMTRTTFDHPIHFCREIIKKCITIFFFMCRRIQFYTTYDFKLLGGHASHNYNELILRADLECSVALFIMTYNCGDTCVKLFCSHLKWHGRIKHLMIIKQSGILNAVDCTGRQSLI